MSDISIRITGRAGHITLQRPEALNAMTYDMCTAIETALDTWAENPNVDLVILDAEGPRAFCAGGDIAELYDTGTRGDYGFGQKFWADEYRLNAKIFTYAKPVVSFLQGFTMGGGVGLGCHGTHRIVGDTSQIAMPECTIGLVPDVGGSLMLALAPGFLGEYLGVTGARMGPADAIYAGFADIYAPEARWPDLIDALQSTGQTDVLDQARMTPPSGTLEDAQADIDRSFAGQFLADTLRLLNADPGPFAAKALAKMQQNSPLSMACTLEMVHRLRRLDTTLSIEKALELEYRFTFRAMEHGDLLEGIRAQIIDKDRTPQWQYHNVDVPAIAISKMLAPLGKNTLRLGGADA
ncbi:MAG: enoyl-CoA hydratase/isomerase family protein [Paracoccaceae bacterium]